eukprot:CAMPEP_0182852930 /NCGR_PEP_ID=MMETSP0034_2-20130328/432_1 /TAXON_ID=156128 /ORGANISM="Nephroselmis pyriformis, Strain CCMP717" /LENGTH=136 /DNA_ID=CAMNT_0024983675 /DNA_START=37 /DNA_END=447 /DNA_ORIENTATION=-
MRSLSFSGRPSSIAGSMAAVAVFESWWRDVRGSRGLPEKDKLRMMDQIEAMQLRDSLRMYNNVVEKCFSDCVDQFRSRNLVKGEEDCVRRCTEKFLKFSARMGVRFAELNQGMEQQAALQAGMSAGGGGAGAAPAK